MMVHTPQPPSPGPRPHKSIIRLKPLDQGDSGPVSIVFSDRVSCCLAKYHWLFTRAASSEAAAFWIPQRPSGPRNFCASMKRLNCIRNSSFAPACCRTVSERRKPKSSRTSVPLMFPTSSLLLTFPLLLKDLRSCKPRCQTHPQILTLPVRAQISNLRCDLCCTKDCQTSNTSGARCSSKLTRKQMLLPILLVGKVFSVAETTTPSAWPPPPQAAHKTSGLSCFVAFTNSPLAVTICTSCSRSHNKPAMLSKGPMPPPSRKPPTPMPEQRPTGSVAWPLLCESTPAST
mmetsp:Transcript_85049/g.168773  ORF Transcript_85049/g.168773 Transcript_85049/m.168773 type:complete len:288 (-) Transcript_85049:562-1425(-)